jgi:hypothetical protein
MIIEVYRGAGDRTGQPITSPLLSDDMLIVRGRSEMNANAHAVTEHTGEIVFRPGLALGQLVQFADITATAPVRAKIVGISISISVSNGPDAQLSMSTNVTLRQSI